MPEIEEEQVSEGFDLQRYLNIARRRHLHFLIPAFFGWLIVWGSAWFLEVRYKSGTLILVQQPSISKNYVTPNITDDLQDRLQSIKQQILSRTRLLTIINKFHLYERESRPLTEDEKVAKMGGDIDIQLVHDSRAGNITAFQIFYWSHQARVAQLVTADLADLFINTNTSVDQHQSENTTEFLKKQLALTSEKLAAQEAKVKSFEAAHQGSLPEQTPANLQILTGLQSQEQSASGALATAKQQREFIQTEISEYKTMHVTSRSTDGKPTGLAALDMQLDQLNTKLTDLLSSHTEQYPDVITTRQQIATTQKARDRMAIDLKAKAAAARNDDTTVNDDPTVSAELRQLQGQLRSNQLEISSREQEIVNLRAKINEYEGRVNGAPAVDQELKDLRRGYDQSQKDYDELLKKEQDSEIYNNVLKQEVRFSVLDPASLPLKPDFPNRLRFCGMGLAAGIALGLIVVAAFEFLDDRMHSEREIKALLPTVVLSEIPEVLSDRDKRSIKNRAVLGWAVTAVIAAIVLAGSAFSYLKN